MPKASRTSVGAKGRAGDGRLGRSHLRVRDLDWSTPPPRFVGRGGRARWPRPRDHDDLYGCDGEARCRRAVRPRRGGPRCPRRTHHEAPRQGLAVGARERPDDRLCRSSNLSHTALFDGLEWNVRLSSMDAAHVIDRVRMMFESDGVGSGMAVASSRAHGWRQATSTRGGWALPVEAERGRCALFARIVPPVATGEVGSFAGACSLRAT